MRFFAAVVPHSNVVQAIRVRMRTLHFPARRIDKGGEMGYNCTGGEGSMMTFTVPRSREAPGAFFASVILSSLAGLQILKPGLAFMALEGRLQ